MLFLAGLPVPAAAQTAQWVVRDVDGALVGPVWEFRGGPALTKDFEVQIPLKVARRIPGKWIQLLVTPTAVRGTRDSVPFFYEDYDCSGAAFLDAPPQTNAVRSTVVFDTGVFWPTGPGETRVIRAKGVLMRDPGQCGGMLVEPDLCCTVVEPEEARFVATVGGTALAELGLRPPFRLEPATHPEGK